MKNRSIQVFQLYINFINFQQQLYEIEERIKNEPPPPINMTLKIQTYSMPKPVIAEEKAPLDNNTNDIITNRYVDKPPVYSELGGRRRKAEKVN